MATTVSTARKRIKQDDSDDEEAPAPAEPTVMLKDEAATKKWKNWWTRGMFTIAMLGGFCFVIWLGHFALTLLVLGIQLKCFTEIIAIGGQDYRSLQLPWWRTLNWYFLAATNFYFYGNLLGHFLPSIVDSATAQALVRYHPFISFSLYCLGFCAFVLTLKQGHYKFQFKQFGWTHLALVLIVMQSHFIIQNLYAGLVWFLLPALLVICNDIMAYMFGFFFGKTQLISLSPKKTWEGFIGAFFSTLFFAVALALFLGQYDFFVCPVEEFHLVAAEGRKCVRNAAFEWTNVDLPPWLSNFGISTSGVPIYPLAVHAIFMSIFASLIAPFGGFFASGLKRAFKVKDFDDLIPGHGGAMDRFDCQLGMATFARVYYSAFVQMGDINAILFAVVALDSDAQLLLYKSLKSSLVTRGLLPLDA